MAFTKKQFACIIFTLNIFYSDNVGTDTPPQTPPNAKGGTSGTGSQGNIMGNANFMAGGSSYGNIGGGSLSSCSRGPALPMTGNNGGQGNATENPSMHQRYQPSNTHSSANNLQSTAFSPVYKK